jgi:hypothetical protein
MTIIIIINPGRPPLVVIISSRIFTFSFCNNIVHNYILYDDNMHTYSYVVLQRRHKNMISLFTEAILIGILHPKYG